MKIFDSTFKKSHVDILVLILLLCNFSVSSSNIQTIPELSNNIYAYGFDNLTLIATFVKSSSGFCAWNINNMNIYELGVPSLVIFTPTFKCEESSICEEVEEDGVTYIVSEMTINIKIEFDVDAFVECDGSIVASWNGLAKNCSLQTNFGVIVENASSQYNSAGLFTCPDDQVLFYLNGSQLANRETICLYSAKWKDEENVQCWSAPSVDLLGKFTARKNENLSLDCMYDDVYPVGNFSKFVYNGTSLTVNKNDMLIIENITKSDNNKTVYCQALTPFTSIYETTGRSPIYQIEVLYPPELSSITSCLWMLNRQENCSVPFSSNPLSSFVELTKNGRVITDGQIRLENLKQDEQVFFYGKEQVAKDDGGTYNIILKTSSFESTTLEFSIIVSEPHPTSSNTLIITISCISVVLVVVIVVVAIMCYRRRRMMQTEKEIAEPKQITRINQDHEYIDGYLELDLDPHRNEVENKGFDNQENNQISFPNRSPRVDFTKIENNVEVVEEPDGYLSLTAIDPDYDDTSDSNKYETIKELNENKNRSTSSHKSALYENQEIIATHQDETYLNEGVIPPKDSYYENNVLELKDYEEISV